MDYNSIPNEHFQYGVVVDAGSSGSRLHIYKWLNHDYVKNNVEPLDQEIVSSVPQILSSPAWNKKISPGLSSFGSYTDDYDDLRKRLWNDHLSELVDFTESIIPTFSLKSTPIFVQATAGMRLLSKRSQYRILKGICENLSTKTQFLIKNCDQQFEIIDGETEGIYGWLSLNYLSGKFNNYKSEEEYHPTLGFMDMGGASTQVAFVPSNQSEVQRHQDDLSVVRLRTINGDTQEWNVFVSTWLGFGANQARARYLKNVISLYGLDNVQKEEDSDSEDEGDKENKVEKTAKERQIRDPCSPKGMTAEVKVGKHNYKIIGIGDYEMCLKDQYPLLLKHQPCEDDPCLFNGVHVPMINFEKDKFVGISEYWYTINDIFNLGGTYSFEKFNIELKKFCESDWNTEIMKNFENDEYNGIKLEFLKDSCFKGSWVVNILHEGFNLPRNDFEKSENDNSENFYFKSAAEINGNELSWTLGKILLYASSKIPLIDSKKSKGDKKYSNLVGIVPSETDIKINGKKPSIPGDFEISVNSNVPFKSLTPNEKISKVNFLFSMFIILFFIIILLLHLINRKFGIHKINNSILYQSSFGTYVFKIQHLMKHIYHGYVSILSSIVNFFHRLLIRSRNPYVDVDEFENTFENEINLEEGLMFKDDENNNHLNFNVPTPFYKNFTANNSVSSLYSNSSSQKSSTGNFLNPPVTSSRLSNQSMTNLTNENHDLTSPQLRSRVSLFNLNTAGGVLNSNNSNYLNIYKSPRNISSTGNLSNITNSTPTFSINDSPKRPTKDF